MHIGVGDSHPFRGMDNIDQPVVIVFVMVKVGRDIAGIDPNVRRRLHGDAVSIVGQDFGDLHIADNDVLLAEDRQSDAGQAYGY